MKKSRYTEEQIACPLKKTETGTPVAELIRRMGVSEQTFYRWKKVYGGSSSSRRRTAGISDQCGTACSAMPARRNEPQIQGKVAESVPLFQQLAGGDPASCDDVCEIPLVSEECRGCAV